MEPSSGGTGLEVNITKMSSEFETGFFIRLTKTISTNKLLIIDSDCIHDIFKFRLTRIHLNTFQQDSMLEDLIIVAVSTAQSCKN